MMKEIKITISGAGFIPGEIQSVIQMMVKDYLIEQGIFIEDAPEQSSLF
ncbi:MAG: hypothetical protein AAFV59_04540 [Pseudomonadota bacterium]